MDVIKAVFGSSTATAALTKNHITISVQPAMGRVIPQEWQQRGWIDYQGIRQQQRQAQQGTIPPGQPVVFSQVPSQGQGAQPQQGVPEQDAQPQQGPASAQPVPVQGPSAAAQPQPVPLTRDQAPPGLATGFLGARQADQWHHPGGRRQRPFDSFDHY